MTGFIILLVALTAIVIFDLVAQTHGVEFAAGLRGSARAAGPDPLGQPPQSSSNSSARGAQAAG